MVILRGVLLLLWAIPLSGFSCTYNFIGAPYTVDYGNIIVQRDTPVGQPISNEIVGTLAHAFTCVTTGNEGSSAGMKSGVLPYAFTSSNGRRVYKTAVQGVGVSFGFYRNSSAGAARFSGTGYIGSDDMITVSWSSNPGDVDSNDFQPIIQFWKTGNIISGSVTGQLASFIAYTAQYRGGEPGGEIPILAGSGSITQVACAIKTPHMTFAFGEINASDFGNTVGTTPASAQKTQSLILDCDNGANITMMLSGAQYPGLNDSSVLALTGQGSAGGQEMFPITARYYQTSTAVTTGSANASATLTLTYQ